MEPVVVADGVARAWERFSSWESRGGGSSRLVDDTDSAGLAVP
jgi:hypothetical protein